MSFRNCYKAIFLLFLFLLATSGSLLGQVVERGADSPIRFGNSEAKTKIEIFVDFQCPSCASFNERLEEVEKEYPAKVEIIFRHFPLPMHDKAIIAAKAVEAARSQGKGLEMIDLIFANQKMWTNDPHVKMFTGYARKLGLDRVKFEADFESSETLHRIAADISRAKFLKLNYTPSVLINEKLITFVESLEIKKIVLQGN